MKLIKKIAAIMFAFMMVFSLSTNVRADDTSGDSKTTTGTITIENSNAGQTYKLYRILNLESYNKTDKAYSYKLSRIGLTLLLMMMELKTIFKKLMAM